MLWGAWSDDPYELYAASRAAARLERLGVDSRAVAVEQDRLVVKLPACGTTTPGEADGAEVGQAVGGGST